MALTKECKQEMEHLLTLVERQKQYRTGVVFPSRMNNYFYDAWEPGKSYGCKTKNIDCLKQFSLRKPQ